MNESYVVCQTNHREESDLSYKPAFRTGNQRNKQLNLTLTKNVTKDPTKKLINKFSQME